MPITVNKAIVGKEYPPFPVTVERGRLKDFARALGDPNPFYVNDAVGTASPWGDVIAPPTFAISFRDETADSGALLRDLGVDISRLLHGEQEFEIHRQLVPGETYLCRTKVLDVYEKTGRSGPMAFVVRETAVTDRTGEIAVSMRQVTVVRL
ncbi:MAG: MaoC family dehydratase [Candidatus Rokuibacteriota bacterium]|nr:MAG: MaoC family dehydratase [Candidatus Rokubacteria bacterium]